MAKVTAGFKGNEGDLDDSVVTEVFETIGLGEGLAGLSSNFQQGRPDG